MSSFPYAGDVWLNPTYRETRALHDVYYLLLGHLFGLGYRRVETRVDVGDTDARKDVQLAGFLLEGVLRKHMVVKVYENPRAFTFPTVRGIWGMIIGERSSRTLFLAIKESIGDRDTHFVDVSPRRRKSSSYLFRLQA